MKAQAKNTNAKATNAQTKPAAKPAAKARAGVAASAPVAPAATLPSNVTPLVTKTKIDMARDIAMEIRAEGYVPKEGSSPRKDFINRCVTELEMTEKGASTYWQNLRNESSGDGLYKNAKPGTGEPRGRKPDVAGRIQKAAAKVQAKRARVDAAMKDLQAAESELVTMATGEAPVAG